nr:cysteine synthase [Sporomusa acidovorans DSM 3132]
MIKDAEEKGLINKDTVIIEPTSGNTGIALAFISRRRRRRYIVFRAEESSVTITYELGNALYINMTTVVPKIAHFA